MAFVQPIRPHRVAPVELHTHAMDNLKFIRETMERAGAFTAVPGWGGILMGISALLATGIASRQTTTDAWLATRFGEGLFAPGLGALRWKSEAESPAVSLPRLHLPG